VILEYLSITLLILYLIITIFPFFHQPQLQKSSFNMD
jgi:hypothetical protein